MKSGVGCGSAAAGAAEVDANLNLLARISVAHFAELKLASHC